jgi:Phage integrase family
VGTINHDLKIVRPILNLAASEWVDEHPKINVLPDHHKRPRIFSRGTGRSGCSVRSCPIGADGGLHGQHGQPRSESSSLKWERGLAIPQLDTSVFIIPATVRQKPRRAPGRAQSVVEACRGISPTHVFTYKGKPITRMMTAAWKRARIRADLPQVRVHDLKHAFGRRLRAAGVSFEDRQDLLGHRSARITTRYSAAELSRLIAAANRVCGRSTRQVELVVLRVRSSWSRRTPASAKDRGCGNLPSPCFCWRSRQDSNLRPAD